MSFVGYSGEFQRQDAECGDHRTREHHPDTGKPYGLSFPVVSIKDFVRVQKALIDSLGIKSSKP